MTGSFAFPVLSIIIFVPIIAAVIMLFIPKEQKDLIRGIAFMAAAIILALGLFVFLSYNTQVKDLNNTQAAALQSAGQNLEGYNLTSDQASAGAASSQKLAAASGTTTATALFNNIL